MHDIGRIGNRNPRKRRAADPRLRPRGHWDRHNTIYFHGAIAASGPGPANYRGSMITFRNTTVGRNPLYEWSARRRDLYLATHDIHASGGIWTRDPSKRVAADPVLWKRGHLDRHITITKHKLCLGTSHNLRYWLWSWFTAGLLHHYKSEHTTDISHWWLGLAINR